MKTTPYFTLVEALAEHSADDNEHKAEAVRSLRRLGREAVARRPVRRVRGGPVSFGRHR